jgi:hypothetical protein
MNRRNFALSPLALSACTRPSQPAQSQSGWPPRYDRILIEKAVRNLGLRFDPNNNLLQSILGPEYRYHTRLHDRRVHPTRDSLEYALYLLEEGSTPNNDRARNIIDRVLNLQVTDPASQWYGIWGWYMEEPPSQMAPADWNWADFNGALLLLIHLRHASQLPAPLLARIRDAIHHAALSIQRRNVSMAYTNIAVQGAFVTLAAAELLNDPSLSAYALDRTLRLARQIDETGSFAEYNSPTYARVTLTNLTRIRMYVQNQDALRRAARIERRAWLHIATHWDAARAQFAGPMSRCYSNDIGYPIWLEKGLHGRLGLANPEKDRSGPDGEAAIHDYRCPDDLIPGFLSPATGREHRELFIAKPETAGATYFTPAFSLGSANRSDFWVQRRPLLAFFGDSARPARTVQLRIVKDGYDFSSALFHSVQHRGRVLAVVSFRNPGGDKHISLDPIKNGEFPCGRLFAELDFDGLPARFTHSIHNGALTLQSSALNARFLLLDARFGAHQPVLQPTTAPASLTLTFDFKPPAAPRLVRWSDVPLAYAAFALELTDPGLPFSSDRPACHLDAGRLSLRWGPLALSALARVDTAAAHEEAFSASIGGEPAPAPRLSQEKLA